MTAIGQDTLNTRSTLTVGGKTYGYYSLAKAAEQFGDISRLPFSMKVLLENMLRFEDGKTVTAEDAKAIVEWQQNPTAPDREIRPLEPIVHTARAIHTGEAAEEIPGNAG